MRSPSGFVPSIQQRQPRNPLLLSNRRLQVLYFAVLNEFLKEHKAFVEEQRKVQEQGATIELLKCAGAKQEATIAKQQKQIEALAAGLQKDLVSDVLPFGRLWYSERNAVSNAIGYAIHYSRSHDAAIRVYDAAENVTEKHEHAGGFKEAL